MRRNQNIFFVSVEPELTRRRKAFTLVEIVAVYAILTVVTVGTYKLFSRLNESVRVTTNRRRLCDPDGCYRWHL